MPSTESSHLARPGAPGAAGGPLIGVAELVARRGRTPAPVLLDVRWTLAGTDRAAFVDGHIPGAVFVDLDTELTAPPGPGGRHPLPAPAVLDGLFARAGIGPDSAVVVYGDRDPSIAARAWWLLRWAGLDDVVVLDGGVAAWRDAGQPVARGDEAAPGDGTARARPGGMPTVDAEGAAALASPPDATGADVGPEAAGSEEAGSKGAGPETAGPTVLLDARAPERYRGETEPVDPRPGHIPGAVNLPLAELLTPDGLLRPRGDLAAILDRAGATGDARAAASCGSGVTACMLVLAGAVIGREIALYPGSYSGWCALGRPVETGGSARR